MDVQTAAMNTYRVGRLANSENFAKFNSGLIWSLWFERDEAIDSGKMEKGSAEQLMPVHVEA